MEKIVFIFLLLIPSFGFADCRYRSDLAADIVESVLDRDIERYTLLVKSAPSEFDEIGDYLVWALEQQTWNLNEEKQRFHFLNKIRWAVYLGCRLE